MKLTPHFGLIQPGFLAFYSEGQGTPGLRLVLTSGVKGIIKIAAKVERV